MSVRQPKPTRKGPNSNDSAPSRRAPAWTGARASPTFSPAPSNARLPNAPAAAIPPTNAPPAFPPLPAAAPRSDADKVLQALTGLTGTTITLNTKTSQRYEGVIASTTGEGDTTGVSLRDVKEISLPGAPLKDQIFIASTNIDTWTSGPADAKPPNGDSFKTDIDISHKPRRAGSERELQAWADSPLPPGIGMSPPLLPVPAHHTDDITFGPGASQNSQWDQFAANERLFGVKTAFDEDLYTTKLDRNAKDFKERERRAQVLAAEILGTTVNNPHIAEERVMNNLEGTGDGVNEEDKYGAVVRGQNAYVPPGARKNPTGKASDIPKVAVNAPDGTAVEAAAGNGNGSSGGSKAPSPAPGGASKPPADALPAFREFVTNEKQRLAQKRSVLMKNDRDKRMADLVKFSQSFKLNKPIPDDLVTILAKDEEKQKQIREKSSVDAASAQARTIAAAGAGAPTPSASSNHIAKQAPTPPTKPSPKSTLTPSASTGNALGLSGPGLGSAAKPKRISMVIQPIPPFKGRGGKPSVNVNTQIKPAPSAAVTPTTANKLNVNASSFKPNPKAVAFTPVSASPNTAVSPSVASASPKPKGGEATAATPSTPNPFFGTRLPKKQPVHIKDDFNPFKYNKVAEASAVTAMWPYQGKRYMQMFPPVSNPPQQQSPHMAPPGPPPMPPPSYEEDSAAQAAAATRGGGYVYAYPPYAYPGQPMMPGMGPPPPGAYMPGPYMQPMHYPPMPPPNGQPMYASPQMGQMPPPQFMPPPPPGQYPPPPPNGGPRPNMPQTPLPAHAHPYYHQSPQRMPVSPSPGDKAMTTPYPYFAVQHAVPYPMMMQPPPPHGYEGPAPPVQMGGHA